MKNHFTSTASTITAALLLLSGSAHGDSVVVLNDEDIASRHDSVQTRTCERGFAVTGVGDFSLSKTDASFSVHVCAEDHTSSTSEGGGVAMAPGSVRVVSGKLFNSAKQVGMTYEYLYHAHCMYIDEEGGVFVGVEVQELTGDHPNVSSEKEDEGDGNDRKLKAETKQSKTPKSEEGSKKSKESKSESEKLSKKSKKSKSEEGCFVDGTGESSDKCPSECCKDGICDECCKVLPTDRDGGRKLKLIHASEEVTSGNEPRGTLGIFHFQRKEDFTEDHARYGISLFDEFDTACSDFADVVSRTEMMFTSKVTQGGFLFQEPL